MRSGSLGGASGICSISNQFDRGHSLRLLAIGFMRHVELLECGEWLGRLMA